MESVTVLKVPQLTKIIVKKMATEHDLVIGQKYLIGVDGGLSTAVYEDYFRGIYYFSYRGFTFKLDSLEGVYVI